MGPFEQFDLKKPFKNDGTPKDWVRILIPFLKKDEVTNLEIVKLFGVKEHEYSSKRNKGSHWLTRLSKAGVLLSENKGKRSKWRKGDNFQEFLGYLVLEIAKHDDLRNDFANMLITYENNSITFIMKNAH